jgi:phage pi2 protein 07
VATISVVLPEQKIITDESGYAERVKASAARIEDMMGWRNHDLRPNAHS